MFITSRSSIATGSVSTTNVRDAYIFCPDIDHQSINFKGSIAAFTCVVALFALMPVTAAAQLADPPPTESIAVAATEAAATEAASTQGDSTAATATEAAATARAIRASATPLDRYVQRALDANPDLLVAKRALDLAKAEQSETARAYLPSLSLNARYTRAGGGRMIDFPIGDLLNPVYDALNDLTNSNDFDQVQNQSFPLLRSSEQESKLQLIQPVYNPAILPGIRARRALTDAADADLERVRADVTANVSRQYLDWLQATEAVTIYRAVLESLDEAVRVSNRLVDAGLATNDAVFRIEADRAQVEQDLANAEVMRDLAASAFNTTLARDPSEPIERMDLAQLGELIRPTDAAASAEDLAARALETRPAMQQLEAAVRAAGSYVQLQKGSYLPSVTLAADYGIQGSGYAFDSEARYRMASLVLQWTLFDGRRRSARVEQASAQQASYEAQRDGIRDKIELQVRQAVWQAQLAERNISVAQRRVRSAESAFRLTERRFGEGLATQLDLLDARTALTNAQVSLSITRFESLKHWVEVRRAASL